MDAAEGPGQVLLVGNFLEGRARQLSEELSLQLRQAGWSVILTSRRHSKPMRLVDVVRTVWRRRDDYQAAHVDVFSGPAFVLAETACRALRTVGRPYVLTLRGGRLPEFAVTRRRRISRLLASARAVTAPSAYLKEQMAPYHTSIEVVPNAMHAQRYPFAVRAQPRPRLMWLRSFHRIYEPELAVETLSRLVRDFPDVTLTMVGADKGDGSLQSTRRRAADLGVTSRVRILGHVAKAEVPRHLASGDVFLNTAAVDNTPMTVCEAMACGLCVVSTDVGGMPYLIEHERDGLLVPRRDPEGMAEAVRRILLGPALASTLSRAGRDKVLEFDWSEMRPRWERLLRELVAGSMMTDRATAPASL